MSQLNVDTIGSQTGNDISIASGKTLKDASGNAFVTSQGLSSAQTFRLTAGIGGAVDAAITSNWEVPDTENQGNMGSLVTNSSGIFSFSETGFYAVIVQASVHGTQPRVYTFATNDNSTYTEVAWAGIIADSGGAVGFSLVILDVTNTTNDKVKFQSYMHSNGGTIYGSTTSSRTSFTFLKLGDT